MPTIRPTPDPHTDNAIGRGTVSELEQARSIWKQTIELLSDSEQAKELGIEPIQGRHKSLLRSIIPTGYVPGFLVLSVPTETLFTLVQSELNERIDSALSAIEGEEASATIVLAAPAPAASAPEAETPEPATTASTTPDQASVEQMRQRPGVHVDPPVNHPADQSSAAEHVRETEAASTPSSGSNYPHAEYAHAEYSHTEAFVDPAQRDHNVAPQRSRLVNARRAGTFSDIPAQMVDPDSEPTLNPAYTFNTFVIGPQNNFAAAAASAVAESPARAYNPLFISGGPGLGKTHLLHAIGHYTRQLYPNYRVRYVSSEEFTNDFINSVRDDAQESFKRRYRELDMLIVDDIQFLEGKEGTQEEFFHTFNALHQADRQIVLSSDRPPRELRTLEDRLRTRFEWGLSPDLQFPDLETRVAILSKKAQLDNLDVPHEVLSYIAANSSSSIRELEGWLLQVNARASLLKQPVTMEMAEEIVGANNAEVHITPELVISVCAEYYGFTDSDLIGPSKVRAIAHARQVAMYLTRTMSEMSLPTVGSSFGGRDHTTVLYAERKIKKEISARKPITEEINELTTRIQESGRRR